MSEPTIPPPSGAICEACGCWCAAEIVTGINVTNGHLWLCRECLGEINRKSPLLHAAEASLATAQAERDELAAERERVAMLLIDEEELAKTLLAERDAALAAVEAARREEREAIAVMVETSTISRILAHEWTAKPIREAIAAAIRSRTTTTQRQANTGTATG